MCVLPFSEKTRRQILHENTYVLQTLSSRPIATKITATQFKNFKVFLYRNPACSWHGFTTTEPITLPIILQHWLVGPLTASFDPAAETRGHTFRSFISSYGCIGMYTGGISCGPRVRIQILYEIFYLIFSRCLFLLSYKTEFSHKLQADTFWSWDIFISRFAHRQNSVGRVMEYIA